MNEPPARQNAPAPQRSAAREAIGVLIACAVTAAALGVLTAAFPPRYRVAVVFLLSVPLVGLVVVASCPYGVRWPARLVRAVSPAVAAGAFLVLLRAGAGILGGVLLVCFAAGLGGLIELLTALRVDRRTAGALAAILAFVLLTTLFWGTQVYRLIGGQAGTHTVDALAAANPMLAMTTRRVLGFDWPTGGRMLMYSRLTRLGEDVPLALPAWWLTSAIWAAAAIAGHLAAWPLRTRRR
jgi:hypothetical protein